MNSKKGCPLLKFVHYKTAQPQNFNYSEQINNYKTINMAEDAPCALNSLYRPINTKADTPEHKINNYRTTSELQVPPVHKIKHFNTIFSTEDAHSTDFNYFRTPTTSKNYLYKCEHFQVKIVNIISQSSRTFA